MSLIERFAEHDWRGMHQAPGPEDTPLHAITESGSDIIEHPEYYGSGRPGPVSRYHCTVEHESATRGYQDEMDSHRVMKAVQGKPDHQVPIYRAVPKEVNHIHSGDWVTLTPGYAQHHGDSNLDPDTYKILKAHVPAKHLNWDWGGFDEFGFNGPDIKDAEEHTGRKPPLPYHDENGGIIRPKASLDDLRQKYDRPKDIDAIMDLLGPSPRKKPEVQQDAHVDGYHREKRRQWQASRPGFNPGDDLTEMHPHAEWVPIKIAQCFREHEGNEGKDRFGNEDIEDDLKSGIGMKDPLMLLHHSGSYAGQEIGTPRATLGEGNHRLRAAEKAGWTHVPMRVVNMSRFEVKERKGVPIPPDWRGTQKETPEMAKPSEVFPQSVLDKPLRHQGSWEHGQDAEDLTPRQRVRRLRASVDSGVRPRGGSGGLRLVDAVESGSKLFPRQLAKLRERNAYDMIDVPQHGDRVQTDSPLSGNYGHEYHSETGMWHRLDDDQRPIMGHDPSRPIDHDPISPAKMREEAYGAKKVDTTERFFGGAAKAEPRRKSERQEWIDKTHDSLDEQFAEGHPSVSAAEGNWSPITPRELHPYAHGVHPSAKHLYREALRSTPPILARHEDGHTAEISQRSEFGQNPSHDDVRTFLNSAHRALQASAGSRVSPQEPVHFRVPTIYPTHGTAASWAHITGAENVHGYSDPDTREGSHEMSRVVQVNPALVRAHTPHMMSDDGTTPYEDIKRSHGFTGNKIPTRKVVTDPEHPSAGVLLHELGHVDHFRRQYDSKDPAFASSGKALHANYQGQSSRYADENWREGYAESFAHHFAKRWYSQNTGLEHHGHPRYDTVSDHYARHYNWPGAWGEGS